MKKHKNKIRILLVDDDEAVRDSLGGLIHDMGYKVTVTESAENAYGLIKKNNYDIYISDIKMPGEDGTAFLKKARKIRPDSYFIMITGHGDEEKAIECLNNGAYAYLRKPLTGEELKITIERCLNYQKLINNMKMIEGIKLAVVNFEDQINNPLNSIILCAEYLKENFKKGIKISDKDIINRYDLIIENSIRISNHIKKIRTLKEIKLTESAVGPILDVFYPYKKS